jgi:iron complex outermembrane receptor protein
MVLFPFPSHPARRHWIALACCLLTGGAVHAQSEDLTALPLEQLMRMEVYSASRFEQKSWEAPSTVTVISAADIRLHGWRTLAEVARSVRGLLVNYDRNYSYLGERGFLRPGDYNTRFLLQVDGNRINDGVYDQAPLGMEFPLDLELIERIEFVTGPGSSVYGSNAFFGVINVITRKAGDLAGTRLTGEAGSAGLRRLHASQGWRGGDGTEVLLSASRHRRPGEDLYYPEYDSAAQNHGVAQGVDHERGERLFARVARGGVSLTLMHAQRDKGIPTAAWGQVFNDPRPQTVDRQRYADLVYRQRGGDTERVTARLFWGAYDSIGDYVNPGPNGEPLPNVDGSEARWWGTELSVLSTRWSGHRVLAGLDLHRDYRLHQFAYELTPHRSILDLRHQGTRMGLYLQDEMALDANWLFNAGLRYDRRRPHEGVASPRAALIWLARPGTTFKLMHGAAFRSPNRYELHYSYPGPGGQSPNPALARERIHTSELAWLQETGRGAQLTFTLYRNAIANLITLQELADQDRTRFDNQQRLGARGAELEYLQAWANGASLRASYSITRVSPHNARGRVNAPTQLAKLNAVVPLGAAGLQAGLEALYVGARPALHGVIPSYLLTNVNLVSGRLLPRTEVALTVTNLFDRQYADPGSTEHLQTALRQDGRALRLRLTHAF